MWGRPARCPRRHLCVTPCSPLPAELGHGRALRLLQCHILRLGTAAACSAGASHRTVTPYCPAQCWRLPGANPRAEVTWPLLGHTASTLGLGHSSAASIITCLQQRRRGEHVAWVGPGLALCLSFPGVSMPALCCSPWHMLVLGCTGDAQHRLSISNSNAFTICFFSVFR